jgi:hypothetical protein
MHKVAITSILIASLAIGLPFAFVQKSWVMVVSFLFGIIWVYPTLRFRLLRSTLSFSILALVCASGIIFGYSSTWILTNIVILLIAWDLFHFYQTHQEFSQVQTNVKALQIQYQNHLKRLALIAGLGWGLGLTAFYIQTNLSFVFGLILAGIALFGLRQVTRLLSP